MNDKELKEQVKKDLPGWKLYEKDKTSIITKPRNPNIKQVGISKQKIEKTDYNELKNRFLNTEKNTLNSKRTTILAQPVEGGSPKVADIINGKIQIIQG